MISNDDIGNLGRLGNQMFQYAALRGLAAKHNYEYCLPPKKYVGLKDPNCANSDTNIFECFQIKEVERTITNFPRYVEQSFELDKNLWENCPDQINIWGYFQTEKYFKHIEEDIRKDFTFIKEISEPCDEFFDSNFGGQNVLSVHIRRGDYLKYPNHPTQSNSYYEDGINLFDKEIPVLVFSDDIEWCKKQKIFNGDRFLFSENNNTAVDLYLQTKCKYHIISNSSFSWWGSWLAKSQKTVAPKIWFAGTDTYKNLSDLYLKDWIVM